MIKTRFLNKFRKDSSKENRQASKKKNKIFCVKLLKTRKKKFCSNSDRKKTTDEKIFGNWVKTNFND